TTFAQARVNTRLVFEYCDRLPRGDYQGALEHYLVIQPLSTLAIDDICSYYKKGSPAYGNKCKYKYVKASQASTTTNRNQSFYLFFVL
ncbi:hypothetical protein CR513_25162, partial [Mucuna pruriens]